MEDASTSSVVDNLTDSSVGIGSYVRQERERGPGYEATVGSALSW